MNLIALAEELDITDLAEIFARKMLTIEQGVCKAQIESDDFYDDEKDDIRKTLANAEGLAGNAMSMVYENWFHGQVFRGLVDDAIERFAGEYTRDV